MLIIFLVISIGLIVLGAVGMRIWDWDEMGGGSLIALSVIASIVLISLMATAITYTVKIPQMEERIAIYKEENARIEEQIKTAIEVYQDYEQEIFNEIDLDKISSEKLLLLTSIYPELKSDTMVQTQIQVYINNTNALKELRTKQLDYELWRWWLCFV